VGAHKQKLANVRKRKRKDLAKVKCIDSQEQIVLEKDDEVKKEVLFS